MATSAPQLPPDLTQTQKGDVEKLWFTVQRPFLTSSTRSVDTQPSSANGNKRNKKSPGSGKIDNDTYHWIVRLHAFFVELLNLNCRVQSGHGNLVPENSSNDNNDDEEEGGDDPEQESSPSPNFVKHSQESAVGSLVSLVVRRTPLGMRKVRLVEGRRWISIHHTDFLQEFAHYEFRGRNPSDEYTSRNSFGAFLYHKSEESALPAMSVAMALAVVTVYREQQRERTTSGRPDAPRTQETSSRPQQSQQSTKTTTDSALKTFLHACQILPRFHHVQPSVRMMDIRTGLAYKFLAIRGHVVKARPKRLQVVTADFQCCKCAATVVDHEFDEGRFSSPTKCSNPSCRGQTFTLQRSTAKYRDIQELRLQEVQEESTAHAGRTPRQMEVMLLGEELIDACRPGDIVQVAATVQAVNSAVAQGKTGKRAQETSTYQLYLKGHSVTSLSSDRSTRPSSDERNQRDDGGQDETKQQQQNRQVVYTQQQLQAITQLAHADHRYLSHVERRAFPFDLLVRSLCPQIIGHHAVKAGIVLCLLGGTPPASTQVPGQSNATSIRSNSHMLICGDPGMGKSQLLLAATQIAARTVYVGGNTASTTGLTVSMTKEAGGEAGIEAGALVLADQGLCCIDEFDKMTKTDGLLEAMEQQQISIAKAGVVASLPARCSILAAANPKHGSYNLSKTVAENLNMATPILSRFDLVFILRDNANQQQDRLVSSKIMNLHRSGSNDSSTASAASASAMDMLASWDGKSRIPIDKRLAWVAQFQTDPLPADLLRDYIAYAREYCKPKLTQEAAVILKDYFMNLRYPTDPDQQMRRKQDTVPITTRQLEALIRLSQARAKACLREYVLAEDARDVVELMSLSVEQVHADEVGRIDRTRGGAGGISQRKRKKIFVKKIYEVVGEGGECGLDDLRRIADMVQYDLNDFTDVVETLRSDGVMMKTSSGRYRIL